MLKNLKLLVSKLTSLTVSKVHSTLKVESVEGVLGASKQQTLVMFTDVKEHIRKSNSLITGCLF